MMDCYLQLTSTLMTIWERSLFFFCLLPIFQVVHQFLQITLRTSGFRNTGCNAHAISPSGIADPAVIMASSRSCDVDCSP